MISDKKETKPSKVESPDPDIPDDLVPDNYGIPVFFWRKDLFQVWNRK
ncbi:MAG: hypothetical protein ACFFA0_05925 [Promethearchaeota archaeon]